MVNRHKDPSTIEDFTEIRLELAKERKILKEMVQSINEKNTTSGPKERSLIKKHIISLKNELVKTNKKLPKLLQPINLNKPLIPRRIIPKILSKKEKSIQRRKLRKTHYKDADMEDLEVSTLDRFKKSRKKDKSKRLTHKKPSEYLRLSSKTFYNYSIKFIKEGKFRNLKKDLIRSNLQIPAPSYLSLMFFSTLASFFVAIFLMIFFLFFNIVGTLPIITLVQTSLLRRFLIVIWLLPAIPIGTYLLFYFYPSIEQKSNEIRINNELPFAVMHMAAISSSLPNQSKIFEIILKTGEYPALNKEFIKLLNEINIYGSDLVTALRNASINSPSAKLGELYKGLTTTITSGGDLSNFFDKRSENLLFDHKLEREKYNKYAETFMDIYISVVIAAPMILMLLLIIMKVSGLGVALSTNMLSLVMVLAITLINAVFLMFLHLKQPPA